MLSFHADSYVGVVKWILHLSAVIISELLECIFLSRIGLLSHMRKLNIGGALTMFSTNLSFKS